jgi:hypothetical protein
MRKFRNKSFSYLNAEVPEFKILKLKMHPFVQSLLVGLLIHVGVKV